jgi:glycosyl-4,4'-diaponeurosporenoate acyltransferase
MQSANRDYLETFVIETCRAELTHWLAMVPVPVFFLWNKWPVGVFMIFYALAANMPCILVQRYNRARLVRVLAKAR